MKELLSRPIQEIALLITNHDSTLTTAYTSLQNPSISSPRGLLVRQLLGLVCSWSRTKLGQWSEIP